MKVSTKKTMILAILAVLLTAATWIRVSEEKNQELIQMSEKEKKEIRNTYYEHEWVAETFGEIEVEYIANENLLEGKEICKRNKSKEKVTFII